MPFYCKKKLLFNKYSICVVYSPTASFSDDQSVASLPPGCIAIIISELNKFDRKGNAKTRPPMVGYTYCDTHDDNNPRTTKCIPKA